MREKLNALNWDESLGYYRHGVSRAGAKPFDWWQLGWVSGGITTLPMLLDGDRMAQARARRNLDFMFIGSPVENGLWRAHHDGTKFNSDDPRPPRPGYQVSVRRLCDGLYYGLRQIMVLRSRGQNVPPAWDASAQPGRRLVARLRASRRAGPVLDLRSGDILIGNTTAGAAAPAGLVLAAEHFREPRYLRGAEAIGRQLERTWLERGLTTGGPCDALAAPDSESCFALVESLVALEEATGKPEWREAGRSAIRLFATWVTSYDYQFPPGSPLARVGAHSAGSVWANVQNKHAAPAICNFSGDALFRHWRASGDEFALELLRDIAHNAPTYVSRERPDRSPVLPRG